MELVYPGREVVERRNPKKFVRRIRRKRVIPKREKESYQKNVRVMEMGVSRND